MVVVVVDVVVVVEWLIIVSEQFYVGDTDLSKKMFVNIHRSLFLRTYGETPKLVVGFIMERDTFLKTIVEIVIVSETFDENNYYTGNCRGPCA